MGKPIPYIGGMIKVPRERLVLNERAHRGLGTLRPCETGPQPLLVTFAGGKVTHGCRAGISPALQDVRSTPLLDEAKSYHKLPVLRPDRGTFERQKYPKPPGGHWFYRADCPPDPRVRLSNLRQQNNDHLLGAGSYPPLRVGFAARLKIPTKCPRILHKRLCLSRNGVTGRIKLITPRIVCCKYYSSSSSFSCFATFLARTSFSAFT